MQKIWVLETLNPAPTFHTKTIQEQVAGSLNLVPATPSQMKRYAQHPEGHSHWKLVVKFWSH